MSAPREPQERRTLRWSPTLRAYVLPTTQEPPQDEWVLEALPIGAGAPTDENEKLPLDVRRNSYTADREPGLHVEGLPVSSGAAVRADEREKTVNEIVAWLRDQATCSRSGVHDARTATVIHAVADHVAREFGATTGEDDDGD